MFVLLNSIPTAAELFFHYSSGPVGHLFIKRFGFPNETIWIPGTLLGSWDTWMMIPVSKMENSKVSNPCVGLFQ